MSSLVRTLLEQEVKKVLAEATKVNFKGQKFILKLGANEDPHKTGIKIQFIPVNVDGLGNNERNVIAIELEKKLEAGLAPYELRVERDRDLKDKTVIGFFIYIDVFDALIQKALTSQETPEGEDDAANA